MSLLAIAIMAAVLLSIAYRVYGSLLQWLLGLDAQAPTPAVLLKDDIDYAPIESKFLLSQHFSAIAAAGPIVGPILAGLWFGWAPALIWILVGSILIGGVHDLTALVASVRHRARSMAEVVREHMSPKAYVLFMLFVWIALVYIIVAFTDVVALSFVGKVQLENGQSVEGSAIASSSALYLLLPLIMGLLLKFTRLSVNWATLIFLPLVGVAIWAGRYIPLDLAAWLNLPPLQVQKLWGAILLVYCFVASLVPVWLLLQPRGHLGGYFLYLAMACFAAGLLFAGKEPRYPAFMGFTSASGVPLFPMLFITIACGACSGFHSIIASGTTCKQLRRETDAKLVGYGAMLLEAMVALMALFCVMMLAPEDAAKLGKPNQIYASGLASFLAFTGIDPTLVITFGLLAFTTFVYDTLDVCTRLGRYILQEFTGWHGLRGRLLSTAIMVAAPLAFLIYTPVDASGKPIPAYMKFWSLFGASNQLLAALTLIGVTVWLWKTYGKAWVWAVTGIPTLWMYGMSSWSLLRFVCDGDQPNSGFWAREGGFQLPGDPVPWVALVLQGLALLVAFEAVRVFLNRKPRVPEPRSISPSLHHVSF